MGKFILFSFFISLNLFAKSVVLVDPTQPLNFQVMKEKKVYRNALPQLQSIVVKEGKRQAILNNTLYQKGQWVNGYQITHIESQKILLKYQNKTYKLTLYSSNERFTK